MASLDKNGRLFVNENEGCVRSINDAHSFCDIEEAKMTAEKYFKVVELTSCPREQSKFS